MTAMECEAYAKINLGLDVLERLENGYHKVRMIMQTISLHDTLLLERLKEPGIVLETDEETLADVQSNLACRAAKLLFEEFDLKGGLHIRLVKRIPVAAGLAGGSSDAAAVLRAVNRLWDLGLTSEQLMERGVKLGADVPYCIAGGTYLAEGIGEVLSRQPDVPECCVLIAKPAVSVSTKWVYEHLRADTLKEHPDIDGMLLALKEQDLDSLAAKMDNVLEPVTKAEHPVIGQIEDAMSNLGAVRAMMSGSGPTVFGLFRTKEQMRHAYEHLQGMPEIAVLQEAYMQPGVKAASISK